jgi:hypothetical protein
MRKDPAERMVVNGLADQFPQGPAEEVAILAVDRRLAEQLGA